MEHAAAAVASATGSSPAREELKQRVFRRCDWDGDGILNKREMHNLACLVGFEGTPEEWDDEYERLCQEHGADRALGVPASTVLQLLDDESDTGCFCTNEELELIANSSAWAVEAAAAPQGTEAATEAVQAPTEPQEARAAAEAPQAPVSASPQRVRGRQPSAQKGSPEPEPECPGDGSAQDAVATTSGEKGIPTTPLTAAAVVAADTPPAAEARPAKRLRDRADEDIVRQKESGSDLVSTADFSRWFDGTELPADTVEFKVEGAASPVRAHAFILAARSEHFRALLADAKQRELPNEAIPISGTTRAALVLALRFLYSGGDVEVPPAHTSDVYELAGRLSLHGLQAQCLKQLDQEVTIENVLSLFIFSERNSPSTDHLKERCVDVIRENREGIISSEDFKEFCANPDHVKSLFLATCEAPPRKRQRAAPAGA